MLDLSVVMINHQRSVIVGPSVVFNFRLDTVYSFGDIAIFSDFGVLA